MWDENKIRIIDIANDLGVSTATVSNVLHGKTKKISDATVKRVEKKLEESGYIPNMAATLLARNNSRIIGVIVKNHEKYEGKLFEDPFVSAAINYLSDAIEDAGYFMMLKKAVNIMDIVRFASMWNLDGLVILGFCEAEYQNLRDHIRIPFVVYDGYMADCGRICNVTIDDVDGGRQVGSYLRDMGHSKVLCIADNAICMDLDRYKGLCEGLGHKADFMLIPMRREERYLFYKKNIKKIREHTAVFAVSDHYAADLMAFLGLQGIKVPQDISVVGFDGSDLCTKVVPQLTSVSQNHVLRARAAIEVLIKMILQEEYTNQICIPVELISRESVKNLIS